MGIDLEIRNRTGQELEPAEPAIGTERARTGTAPERTSMNQEPRTGTASERIDMNRNRTRKIQNLAQSAGKASLV